MKRMAERRFTRLKASLSETAAKAREHVSREFRQSLVQNNSNSDSIQSLKENFDKNNENFFIKNLENIFEDNYEEFLRSLQLKSILKESKEEENDFQIIKEENDSKDCPQITEISGGFAKQCCLHLSQEKEILLFNNYNQYFGSIFDCLSSSQSQQQLSCHLFCDDSDSDESERRVIRESSCLMNRMTGWLTLYQHFDTCFLSFFRDRKRSQIVWTQEVTKEVSIIAKNTFKVESHSIEVPEEEVEEWVKDINDNRFDVERHVNNIQTTSHQLIPFLDQFFSSQEINLFSTFSDLNERKGIFSKLRENQLIIDKKEEKNIFSFIASFQRSEINENNKSLDRNSFLTKISVFDSQSGRISSEVKILSENQKLVTRRHFRIDLNESKYQDLFLVARVERIIHDKHREPFLWSSRPIFKSESRELDTNSGFLLFYRSNNLSDDHMTQSLNQSKGTTVSAKLSLNLEECDNNNNNNNDVISLSSLRPIGEPIERFENYLFVSLNSLRFENQKHFSKARNLCIYIEIREDDNKNSNSLQIIEEINNNNNENQLLSESISSVTRHSVNPEFCEEIKVKLPLQMKDKLHLLFKIYHISCKKDSCVKTSVGFSWLPINHKTSGGTHHLSVFASLPDSYLQCQSLGLGRGLSMPEAKLVLKDCLKISCRFVSSLISCDPIIETAMDCITQINSKETEISRAIACERSLQKNLNKLIQSSDKKELLRFSNIILQQLLLLISRPNGCHSIQYLLQLLSLIPNKALNLFILKYFSSNSSDFHITLISSLNRYLNQLEDNSSSSSDYSSLLLKHLSFFTKIHIKCCVQYLIQTKRLNHKREERFDQQFSQLVSQFVFKISKLIVTNSRLEESYSANRSLSHYLTRLLSFCERNLIFKLYSNHLNETLSRDILISELRLMSHAIISSHEYFLEYNFPQKDSFYLNITLDYRKQHFSLSLLLQEFKYCLSDSVRHTRQQLLQLLRNLLAKHELIDKIRYNEEENCFSLIIAALYLPIIQIVLENVNRIIDTKLFIHNNEDNISSSHSPSPSSTTNTINTTVSGSSSSSSLLISQHIRHNSLPVRFDHFNSDEVKDILVIFSFVLKYLNEKHFKLLNEEKALNIIQVMSTAIHIFEYKSNDGKREEKRKAKTLPINSFIHNSFQDFIQRQNISIQISLIALKSCRILLQVFSASNQLLEKSLSLLLSLLSTQQSLHLLVHIFDNTRHIASEYSSQLFSSPLFPSLLSRVIYYCDSHLKTSRDSATDLLFYLFLLNFRRTRFETIVCVSRLASKDDVKDLTNFQLSLSRLYLLSSNSNQRIQLTVERVRDILRATQRIRQSTKSNPYESCELRLFLANSYAQTSLRRTWLENLAESHRENQDWPEYAMCLSHVIAIVVHELRSKGFDSKLDSKHLIGLSKNLLTEQQESDKQTDEGLDWLEPDDSSIETLRSLIDECVLALERCELFELCCHPLKLLIEVYERDLNHLKLSNLYTRLAQIHSRAQQLNDSGKRIYDTYFRVAFLCSSGQSIDEFIYRETKVVSLAEMTQKLRKLHPNSIVGSDTADASIHVTHVSPINPDSNNNEFYSNVGIKHFQYEKRLSIDDNNSSSDCSSVAKQRKKRVVLIAQHFLPFCVKRVPVVERKETILSPIEVAIDEMAERVKQLERVIALDDAKHLQLVLQGSVQVQVNQGPLAYAEAFLSSEDNEFVPQLKELFQRFLDLCDKALKSNERLIKSDQLEYQMALRSSFDCLRNRLYSLVSDCEPKRTSVQIFDVISGSSLA